MSGQVLDERAHLARHGIALFLGLEACPIVQTQKHFTNFVLARFAEDDYVERVIVELQTQVFR